MKFIKEDIPRFCYEKSFDIVHSEGVLEHFSDDKILEIVKKYGEYTKNGGYIMIFVPYPTWYYRIWKKWLEERGKWVFGYEKALKRGELIRIIEKVGLSCLDVIKVGRCIGVLAKKSIKKT